MSTVRRLDGGPGGVCVTDKVAEIERESRGMGEDVIAHPREEPAGVGRLPVWMEGWTMQP